MSTNPWLAIVALQTAEMPALAEIAKTLAGFEPTPPAIADGKRAGNVETFRLGEAVAALTLFPAPIPWQHVEGPCECAWYWPDAADAFRGHRAHILITLIDDGRDEVRKATLLTQLTAAVASLTDSVGIFWGPGRLVHPPHAFLELARSIERTELPLYLWVDFRISAREDDAICLFTTGMEALRMPEIEVDNYRGDIVELRGDAYNVAHYMLDKQRAIKDGDTVGLSDSRTLTVRRGPSLLDENKEVVQLEFE